MMDKTPLFSQPKSIAAALVALTNAGGSAVPVAGATWVMRAPLRHEVTQNYVSLAQINALHQVELAPDKITIGPMVTHDTLSRALEGLSDLHVLAQAADKSANPGVRRLATIGGNLCTNTFPAADLVPALLSLDAQVKVENLAGTKWLSIPEFLTMRESPNPQWLLTEITVPRTGRASAHTRLTMRKAGDYPCAIVSVSVAISSDGTVQDPRIAVGAVEQTARRWHRLEAAIRGARPVPGEMEAQAKALLGDFAGRDAVDAPGWYRLSVLPVLIRRAFETIQNGARL